MKVEQITPRRLLEMQENGDLTLLDVRERDEWEICRIDGAQLIPLSRFSPDTFSPENGEPIVVYCHTGQRSALVTRMLRENGYERVYNLQGGIDAYSYEVDPEIPRY